MEEVLSEEVVKKDNEMGGNIPGGNFLGEDLGGGGAFSRRCLMGGDFPGVDFPKT